MSGRKKYNFDEETEAEKILQEGFPKGIQTKKMYLLAKYFRQQDNLGEKKLEKKLIEFCRKQDSNFNPVLESENISRWVKYALKYNLRKTGPVIVTHAEMERLREIKDLKHRKILFGLLVFSKSIRAGGTSRKTKDKAAPSRYFIQFSKFSEIIEFLGLRITNTELADILFFYVKSGMLELYPPTKELVEIKYAADESAGAITIKEHQKVMEYYRSFFGGDVIYCSNCGKEIVKTSNNMNYCPTCSKERVRERDRRRKKRNSTF